MAEQTNQVNETFEGDGDSTVYVSTEAGYVAMDTLITTGSTTATVHSSVDGANFGAVTGEDGVLMQQALDSDTPHRRFGMVARAGQKFKIVYSNSTSVEGSTGIQRTGVART